MPGDTAGRRALGATMKASVPTALLAGVLGTAGLFAFRAWLAGQPPASPWLQFLWWALAALLLFALPGWYWVIGVGQRGFDRLWFRDAAETKRFAGMLHRVLAWFLASVATSVGLSWV